MNLQAGCLVIGLDDPAGSLRAADVCGGRALTNEPAEVVVTLEVGSKGRPDATPSRWISRSVDEKNGVAELQCTEWSGRFCLEEPRACVALQGPWPGAVESVIKVVLQLYCPLLERGLVLHASSACRDGRAWVFMGRSGAGKSSAARLAGESGATVLSDEVTVVAKGDEGGWAVHPLPIRQKGHLRPPLTPVRVAGLFHLVQSPVDEVRELCTRTRMATLAHSIALPVTSRALVRRTLALATELTTAVQVRELRFRATPGFLRVVECSGTSS